MSEEEGIFKLKSEEMPYLKEKVAKLNRKAAQIGCVPIQIEEISRTEECIAIDRIRRVRYTAVVFRLIGDSPKINGWEFAATLEPVENEDGEKNLVNRMPGFEGDIPVEYRTASMLQCDHCHTKRRRNETFVIRNVDTGEYKVVGRQCIKDFMGYHASPAALVRLAKGFEDLVSEIDSLGDEIHYVRGGRGYRETVDLKEYLFRAAYFVKKHGYVRLGAEDEYGRSKDSTKMEVWNTFWIPMPMEHWKDYEYYGFFYNADGSTPENFGMCNINGATMRKSEYTEAKDYMDAAIKYICTLVGGNEDDLNDYLYNLRTVMQMRRIEWKHAGYAASIYAVYEKHLGAERDQHIRAKSEWQGEIGKKITVDVMLVETRGFEGAYGWSEILTFTDTTGNYYKWFTNTREKLSLAKGDIMTLTATVKKHELYKDAKSTVITRAKVTKHEEE